LFANADLAALRKLAST